MSDSPCHTSKKGINKIDEYMFREDRKNVVNFKPGERTRKMFIQSASFEPSFVSPRSMVVLVGGWGRAEEPRGVRALFARVFAASPQ